MSSTATRTVRLPSTNRYEFQKSIGAGGMGMVYRALDRRTGELVAVKVLKAKLSENPTLHHRMAREFRAASELEHPNIVRALSFENDGEISFLVSELVEGGSLGARIEQCGRLPEAEAVRIITQVAQALHYAHLRNVVHRDVKPDNILVLPDGRAKLTDFGLAKDYNDDNQDLTRQASGLGTPHFMAPEQFASAKTAGPRCDIYSLGATLYNAVTGRLPFDGPTTLAILTKKELGQLRPVRQLAPGLSERVEAAILASLDPTPAGRPTTCLEFFKLLTTRRRGIEDPTRGPALVPVPTRPCTADDRRTWVRHNVGVGSCATVSTALHGGGDESWPLVVRDLSVGGAGVLLARRFEPGTELTIELAAGPGAVAKRLAAHVVRVQPERGGHWVHGCEFNTPLTDNELATLIKFA
jgi:serine/threonine protein kinase